MTNISIQEAAAEARRQLDTLWAMWLQLAQRAPTLAQRLDIGGQGAAVQQVLADTKTNLAWLGGEGLSRLEQGTVASLPFGTLEEAWIAWREAAIAVGDVLNQALGLGDKWAAGKVLAQMALDATLYVAKAGERAGAAVEKLAGGTADALPFVGLAVGALVVLFILVRGGK
jgi:hypothetical protein